MKAKPQLGPHVAHTGSSLYSPVIPDDNPVASNPDDTDIHRDRATSEGVECWQPALGSILPHSKVKHVASQ